MENKKNFYSGITFLIFSIFVYYMSTGIKISRADALGPQFLPKIVSIFLGILSMTLILKNYKFSKNSSNDEKFLKNINKPLIATIILLFTYTLMLETIGFVILTIIYLFAQIQILSDIRKKNKFRIIIELVISLGVPLAIYYLFYYGFNIFLPSGLLG